MSSGRAKWVTTDVPVGQACRFDRRVTDEMLLVSHVFVDCPDVATQRRSGDGAQGILNLLFLSIGRTLSVAQGLSEYSSYLVFRWSLFLRRLVKIESANAIGCVAFRAENGGRNEHSLLLPPRVVRCRNACGQVCGFWGCRILHQLRGS